MALTPSPNRMQEFIPEEVVGGRYHADDQVDVGGVDAAHGEGIGCDLDARGTLLEVSECRYLLVLAIVLCSCWNSLFTYSFSCILLL